MRVTKDTPISELYHSEVDGFPDDELMHWKYIKREKVKGKWKYWYDTKSLKKDLKNAFTSVSNKTRKFVDSGAKTVKRYVDTTVKTVSKKIDDVVKDATKRTHKYIAKVPSGDTYRYFYSEKAYQAYLKGKNAVDKALDKNINATASDTAKTNAKNFTFNALFGNFGKAVYNVVAPAFVAIQTALTTPKSFSELKKTTTKESSEEAQKKINDSYSSSKYDYSMNCSFCTAAYDLRKRGYDVEANPISTVEAYTIQDVCTWYKGAKSVSESEVINPEYRNTPRARNVDMRAQALTDSLKKQGEGARGHLALYWSGGGGHDVVWEVENGEVVIRDSQTNKNLDIRTYMLLSRSYDYVRIDNLEPTDEVLRTVRNRKKR